MQKKIVCYNEENREAVYMGLFDKLLSIKDDIINSKNSSKEVVVSNPFDKDIDSIIAILKNLGVLDEAQIVSVLKTKKVNYDSSVLKRLLVKFDSENTELLRKYFLDNKLGYGENKISEIKNDLYDLSIKLQSENKSKDEIVELLIARARSYIAEYKKSLTSYNDTIKLLENNVTSKAELIGMIDYWTNFFKEQSFGYTINLNDRIDTMALELRLLPYGGYGDKEIRKFIEEAYKIVTQGKSDKESTKVIYSKINDLFNKMKNRYMADIESLKKKISLINESEYINDTEKNNNKKKVISEFNIMNGHGLIDKRTMNDSNSVFLIEVNIQKLMNLPMGGYGPEAIKSYRCQCEKIMNGSDSEENKYIQINKVALLLVDIFYYNLDLFNRWRDKQLEGLVGEQREKRIESIDKQIRYMLSLSPKALNDYYINDDTKKRKLRDKHNLAIAIKFLAKAEAKKTNDPLLYDRRLEEYKKGIINYSSEDIENAMNQLEVLSIVGDDKSDVQFISIVDYIDSTLINQLLDVESSSNKVGVSK